MILFVRQNFSKTKHLGHIDKNISFEKFNKVLSNTFSILNNELEMNKKLKIFNFNKFILSVIKKRLFVRIKAIRNDYLDKLIKIQAFYKSRKIVKYIRRLKKFKRIIINNYFFFKLKSKTRKAIVIQKTFRCL